MSEQNSSTATVETPTAPAKVDYSDWSAQDCIKDILNTDSHVSGTKCWELLRDKYKKEISANTVSNYLSKLRNQKDKGGESDGEVSIKGGVARKVMAFVKANGGVAKVQKFLDDFTPLIAECGGSFKSFLAYYDFITDMMGGVPDEPETPPTKDEGNTHRGGKRGGTNV
jgi:hypothetical protein